MRTWTSLKLKLFALYKIPVRELKTTAWEKNIHNTFTSNKICIKNIKNSYTSIVENSLILKMGKISEQILHQRRYTEGKYSHEMMANIMRLLHTK